LQSDCFFTKDCEKGNESQTGEFGQKPTNCSQYEAGDGKTAGDNLPNKADHERKPE